MGHPRYNIFSQRSSERATEIDPNCGKSWHRGDDARAGLLDESSALPLTCKPRLDPTESALLMIVTS
jgi:hypothetical protein